jgi:hypothetical protein
MERWIAGVGQLSRVGLRANRHSDQLEAREFDDEFLRGSAVPEQQGADLT